MKILLLFIAAGVAVGSPLVFESILKKGITTEKLLHEPMTSVSYEQLFPVVEETLNTFLHDTIPEDCTKVAIPYIALGIVRMHVTRLMRDVMLILQTSTIKGPILMEEVVMPTDFERHPAGVQLEHVRSVLHRIRELLNTYRTTPVPPFKEIERIQPIYMQLEIGEAILSVLHEQVSLVHKTLPVPVTEPVPFEKLIAAVIRPVPEMRTPSGVVTLKDWLSMVTMEMKKNLDFNPAVCRSAKIEIPKMVAVLESFITRVNGLSIESIVSKLPTTIRSTSVAKEILVKVVPIIKNVGVIEHMISTLKHSSLYESEFMHFITKFVAERCVSRTIRKMDTTNIVSSLMTTKPEILKPVVYKIVSASEKPVVVTKMLTELVTRLAEQMNARGIPIWDCVEILLTTLDTMRPTTQRSAPQMSASWEETIESISESASSESTSSESASPEMWETSESLAASSSSESAQTSEEFWDTLETTDSLESSSAELVFLKKFKRILKVLLKEL